MGDIEDFDINGTIKAIDDKLWLQNQKEFEDFERTSDEFYKKEMDKMKDGFEGELY